MTCIYIVEPFPCGGLKKLKKESFCTVLVTVRVVPLPLCFCFFFIVLTVTFFPFFQSISQLQIEQMILGQVITIPQPLKTDQTDQHERKYNYYQLLQHKKYMYNHKITCL